MRKSLSIWSYLVFFKKRPENMARMKKGLAPRVINGLTGELESIELHHPLSQREGGIFEFIEVTKQQHAKMDPHRFVKGG